jgi:hypothetical protein
MHFLYALLFAQNFILVKSGCYKHHLTFVALHHLQLLLNRLEPIININWLHGMRKGWC